MTGRTGPSASGRTVRATRAAVVAARRRGRRV